MARRYFDHNATTPLDPRVRAAMVAGLELCGNPSSVHTEGRAARDALERARRSVAGGIGAEASDVVFTSGGTEADRLGVVGLARAGRERGAPARVLVCAIEHPAVRGAADSLRDAGFEVETVAVTGDGVLDPAELGRALGGGAALVAVALANHELGTVQAIAELAARARGAGAYLHCDAVGALGKIPVDVGALGADGVAISAHKIGGPMGAGALWVRGGVDLAPIAPAGHQERGRRPGTEPFVAALGFGAAAELLPEALADAPRIAALRDRFEAGLGAVGDVRIHGALAPRVGNTCNLAAAGASGEVVVTALDLAGFALSTGAACSSGTVEPSPVLRALGQSRSQASEAVRLSLGRGSTDQDIDALLEVLPPIVARARAFAV